VAYTRYIALTVDHTKVNSTDQTNFTWPFSVTHTELRTVANGGLVTNASGFDIATFSDTGASTSLKFQRLSYSATAGTITGVVKSPTLSASVDPIVYLCYGNSSITTDQQDAANAWDATTITAKGAFGDGTTLDLTDHSGSYTLTNTGATAAAGLIAGAASFNGTSNVMEKTSAPFTAYPATVVALFKPSASVTANREVVSVQERANASIVGVGIRARATDEVRAKAGGAADTQTANGVLNSSAWHLASAVFTSSTSRRLIVDAATTITGTAADSMTASLNNLSVGASFTSGAAGSFFSGLINTYIIYNVTKPDSWLLTLDAAFRGIATFSSAAAPAAIVAALSFSAQPPASVTSGVAMATVTVTADAGASGLTCTLTLVGPSGSVTNNTAICNGSGIATFSTLTATGDGPGYTMTAAVSGYTGATSSSFTVIGAVVAANQALVTAMGGDSFLFTVHDARVLASGALTSFPDSIGAIGGRPAGCTMTGSGATVSGGVVSLIAASTPYYVSAADSRLILTGGTFASPVPVWLLTIGSASGNGEFTNIAADPTSTTTYPYLRARTLAGTWQAAFASDGAAASGSSTPIPRTAGAFVSDSGVAFAGGAIRATCIGKMGYQSPNTDQSTQVNGAWMFLPNMGGEQPRPIHRATASTAGNCKLALGRFGATYATASLSWMGVYTGDLTLTKLQAFQAFARAQFGATIDIVAVPSLAFTGNSHVTSQTDQAGGDMQTPIDTSGTTSMPYYMAHKTSGTRGSLITQGLKLSDTHAYSWGRSGKNILQVLDTFDVEIALLADGTRTGPVVVLFYDIGNAIGPGVAMDQTTYLANLVLLKNKCDTLAATSGRVVNLIHILDSDRNSYYNANWPTIPSGYSANGTLRNAIGVAMLADPLTYGSAVFDIAANVSVVSIGTFAAPKCYSTTYYDITANSPFAGGDATHLAPLGYQAMGEGIKTGLFDVIDTLLYPLSTAVMRRRRR
jgi:hypothetical protein